MTFPNTVEELLQLLDDLIPEPSPKPSDTHEQMLWDAGRRSVVLQLRELRKGAVAKPLQEKRGIGRVRR